MDDDLYPVAKYQLRQGRPLAQSMPVMQVKCVSHLPTLV